MPLTLLLTIGLTIVILAVAAGLTARSRRARPAVMGVGLALLPVGLYLTGITQLLADAVLALIDWFMATPWTILTSWGLGLFLGGVVLIAVGVFLPKGRRAVEPSTPTRPAGSAKQPQVAPGPAKPGVAQPPAKSPAAKPGLDPEDAEIEALLRKRGIM